MTTPYRNEIEALRERKAALENEIARLNSETQGLDMLRARQAQLATELAAVDGRLGANARRALPLLDQVKIASPCSADWNQMVGDDRVRFCNSCEKNVYNLSSMPREHAEALLQDHLGGDVCVRFYQRVDGTIMTQDCPVGAKKKRRKLLAIAVAGAGAIAASAVAALASASKMGGVEHHQVYAGAVAYDGPAPTVPPVAPTAPTTTANEIPFPVAPQRLDPQPPRPTMGAVARPPVRLMGKPSMPRN